MTVSRWPVGVSTWPELATFDGNVLVVINSPEDDREAAGRVLDLVESRTRSGGVHVIAPPTWQSWLADRGLSGERVLPAVARLSGEPVEVNHFLETSEALLWLVPRQFQAIAGTTPHNQYNEEVQTVFEQRVSLIIGDGVLLAHCVPLPYLYVLDGAALVHRFGRSERVRDYQRHARELIDDLYRHWQAAGRPPIDDRGGYDATRAIVEKHLGRELVAFDEQSPIVVPVAPADGGAAGAGVLRHLLAVLHARDVALAERSEAVAIRDRLLAEERDRYAGTLDARLRRAARKAGLRAGGSE